MLKYFVERYAQMAKQNLGTDTLDIQILYSIRLYCYGTLGMTREWVFTDNITPARTDAPYVYNLLIILISIMERQTGIHLPLFF